MLIRPRYFTMEFKFLLGRALKPDPSASHRFLRRRKRVSYRGQNWPLGRALRGHRPTKQPVENGSALLLDSNSSPFWTDDVTCQKTTKLDQTELSEGPNDKYVLRPRAMSKRFGGSTATGCCQVLRTASDIFF